jgi:hypothetical protein
MSAYKTIEQSWVDLKNKVDPENEYSKNHETLRRTYYMGFSAAMSEMLKLIAESDEATVNRVLTELQDEFKAFVKSHRTN